MQKDMRKKLDKSIKIPHKQQAEDQGGDIFQFLAVITSFQAVIFKYKIFFWISIFCVLSSFFNKKKSVSISNYFIVVGMLALSFVNIYLVAPKPAAAPLNN